MKEPIGRLRTAGEARKALRQYGELVRAGRVRRAVIIAEKTDGNFDVLGQMTDPGGVAQLLMVAAEALKQVPAELIGGEAPPPRPGPSPMKSGKPVLSLAAEWASYWAACGPEDAPPAQRTEMRRAFYVGARCTIEVMLQFLEPGDDVTPGDITKMDALWDETERFLQDMHEGRA